MKIRGVIFDLDGTLIDSMSIWDTVGAEYLAARGLSVPEDGRAWAIGLSLEGAAREMKERFSLPEDVNTVMAELAALVEEGYRRVRPKEGVPELLSALAAAGVPMAVATLTERPLVLSVLSRLGLLSYFTAVLTCAEVGAGKDSPAVYEAARARLGTSREETAVFEDSHRALLTAHRAGFFTVAVADPSPECDFAAAAAHADLAVPTPSWEALRPYLDGLPKKSGKCEK